MLRSNLQKLVGIDVLNCLLQTHDLRRNKAESLVARGGTCVGQVLRLADIDFNVLGLTGFSDDHAGVHLFTCTDEENTALLCIEQTVGDGLAAFEGNQRALLAVGDVSLVGLIAGKNGVHDAVALGVGHELSAVANQPAGRNSELETGVAAVGLSHGNQLTLSLSEDLNDVSGKLIRNINDSLLHRLQFLAVLIVLVDDLCLGNRKLIALAAHGLNEDGQMELASSGNLEGIGGIGIFNAKGYVRIQLAVQTVTDVP